MFSVLIAGLVAGVFAGLSAFAPKKYSGMMVGLGIGLGLAAASAFGPSLSVRYELHKLIHMEEVVLPARDGDAILPNIFASLEKHEPERLSAIKSDLIDGARDRDSNLQQYTQTVVRNSVSVLMRERIPYFNDAQMNDYMDFTAEIFEHWKETDPLICANLSLGYDAGDVSNLYTKSLLRREFNFIDQAIKTNTAAKNDHLSDEEYLSKLKPLVEKINTKFGQNIFRPSSQKALSDNASQICDATIELYESVAKLPKHESAILMRRMMSDNT